MLWATQRVAKGAAKTHESLTTHEHPNLGQAEIFDGALLATPNDFLHNRLKQLKSFWGKRGAMRARRCANARQQQGHGQG